MTTTFQRAVFIFKKVFPQKYQSVNFLDVMIENQIFKLNCSQGNA
jgi:hypothetical protein